MAILSLISLEEERELAPRTGQATAAVYRELVRQLTPGTVGQLELGPEERPSTELSRLRAAAKAERVVLEISRQGNKILFWRSEKQATADGIGPPRPSECFDPAKLRAYERQLTEAYGAAVAKRDWEMAKRLWSLRRRFWTALRLRDERAHASPRAQLIRPTRITQGRPSHQLSAEELDKLSAAEQATWLRQQVDDWPQFVRDIEASLEELAAYRASGNTGFPPGWISFDDYRAQRGVQNSS
jgi:hypothetical protein